MKPKMKRKGRRPSRRTTDAMMDAIDENGDLKIMMGLCVQCIEESAYSTPEGRAAAAYICFMTRTGGVEDPALASLLSSCVDDTDWMDVADYVTSEDPTEALRQRLTGDNTPPKMRMRDHPEYARWTERRPPASISCSLRRSLLSASLQRPGPMKPK